LASAALKFYFLATDSYADLTTGFPIPVLSLAATLELAIAIAAIQALLRNRFSAAWLLLTTTWFFHVRCRRGPLNSGSSELRVFWRD
jgi:hypothetical protein